MAILATPEAERNAEENEAVLSLVESRDGALAKAKAELNQAQIPLPKNERWKCFGNALQHFNNPYQPTRR